MQKQPKILLTKFLDFPFCSGIFCSIEVPASPIFIIFAFNELKFYLSTFLYTLINCKGQSSKHMKIFSSILMFQYQYKLLSGQTALILTLIKQLIKIYYKTLFPLARDFDILPSQTESGVPANQKTGNVTSPTSVCRSWILSQWKTSGGRHLETKHKYHSYLMCRRKVRDKLNVKRILSLGC